MTQGGNSVNTDVRSKDRVRLRNGYRLKTPTSYINIMLSRSTGNEIELDVLFEKKGHWLTSGKENGETSTCKACTLAVNFQYRRRNS